MKYLEVVELTYEEAGALRLKNIKIGLG